MPQIVKTIAKLIRGSCDGLNGVVSTKNKQPTTKNKQLTTRPQSINNSFGVSVFFEAWKMDSVWRRSFHWSAPWGVLQLNYQELQDKHKDAVICWIYPPHQMKVHRDSLLKISKNVIMLVLTVTGLGGGSNVCWCWLFQKDFILKLFLKVQKLGFHNWCPYLALGCLVAQIFIAPCVFYILTIINQYDDRLQAKQRAAKLEKDCDAAGSLSDNRKKSVDPLQSGKPKWTLEFFSWDAG